MVLVLMPSPWQSHSNLLSVIFDMQTRLPTVLSINIILALHPANLKLPWVVLLHVLLSFQKLLANDRWFYYGTCSTYCNIVNLYVIVHKSTYRMHKQPVSHYNCLDIAFMLVLYFIAFFWPWFFLFSSFISIKASIFIDPFIVLIAHKLFLILFYCALDTNLTGFVYINVMPF